MWKLMSDRPGRGPGRPAAEDDSIAPAEGPPSGWFQLLSNGSFVLEKLEIYWDMQCVPANGFMFWYVVMFGWGPSVDTLFCKAVIRYHDTAWCWTTFCAWSTCHAYLYIGLYRPYGFDLLLLDSLLVCCSQSRGNVQADLLFPIRLVGCHAHILTTPRGKTSKVLCLGW